MKKILMILLVLGLLAAIPGLSPAECNKGRFLKMRGVSKIELGELYKYSVQTQGQIESHQWNVVGGKLIHEWRKGDNYYAEIRWETMNVNDPRVKITGKDDCKMQRTSELHVTQAGGSRGQSGPGNQSFALDANGGKGSPYLNSNLAQNENLLWKLQKYDDRYVLLVPKVNQQAALDAHGGSGEPYLNQHIGENINLLWQLKRYDQYYMIVPKLNTKAALDANGGKGKPYLNQNSNPQNVNHLWILEKHGDYHRILSKIGASN